MARRQRGRATTRARRRRAGTPARSRSLYDYSPVRAFTGRDLGEVAFPLGGVGTGTISLGGRGDLRDWEIFNSPGKGNDIGPALFALWCRPAGGRAEARVLEAEPMPPFMARATYGGGHGIPRAHLPGLPRFRKASFRGEYPFAWLELADPAVPLAARLEAFNPMIPLNAADSGIPAAVFNWTFTNRTRRRVALSLAAVLRNPLAFRRTGKNNRQSFGRGNRNEFVREGGATGLRMSATRIDPADPAFGTAALATAHGRIDAQTHWHRGAGWWDDAHLFWDDFSLDGRVEPALDAEPAPDGASDVGDLVLRASVAPGRSVTLTVVLAWHFPNRLRRAHWDRLPEDDRTTLTNWYATRWPDAWAVARYTLANLDRLTAASRAYHDALFSSSLPNYVLDAVSSQASIVRTASCLRLADGSFHGFEGCSDDRGCCPMNCTHVWNYAQSAAFLFPALERSVRETDFLHNTRKAGKVGAMAFRTILPVGSQPGSPSGGDDLPQPTQDYDPVNRVWEMLPAADGQMGTIMRAYREWRIGGDRAWLGRIWPGVVRALEFAWLGEDGRGANAWDPGRTGVVTGRQHNTYDIEFFGPNPLTSVMYLGALRAGEELAREMGEPARAAEYRRIYEGGRAWIDRNLWRRDYYVQRLEVRPGIEVPQRLRSLDGTPKYQVGAGCLSDQLLGQFLAHVCGLGHLLDAKKTARAMRSIFRCNFRRRLGDHANVQRVYGVGEEAGLLLCSWPKGRRRGSQEGSQEGSRGGRPQLPFVYCDEVWTGVEYQVAAGLIWEGLLDEGLTIVRSARDRYAGFNRNPFDEVECGHHYVRAMASWGLLPTLSGFSYDAASAAMAFSPRLRPQDFRCFYSTGSSWGSFAQKVDRRKSGTRDRRSAGSRKEKARMGRAGLTASLRVDYGSQTLRTLTLAPPGRRRPTSVRVTGTAASAALSPGPRPGEVVITFDPPATLAAGQTLTVRLK